MNYLFVLLMLICAPIVHGADINKNNRKSTITVGSFVADLRDHLKVIRAEGQYRAVTEAVT